MQKFKAAVHVEMDANNPSKFISLNLNLEALLVIVFAAVVLIIGLAHSCSRPGVPAAPGRVESEPSQINERQDERINGQINGPEAQTTELSVLPVANHAPKPKGPVRASRAKQPAIPDAELRYILRFQKIAVTEMKRFKIPASIKMAQGLLESQAGRSGMAREINNHFGIKCHSRTCGKGHCANYHDDSNKDFFRRFGNAWESWRAHSNLLQGDRYAWMKGKDWKAWAYGLKKSGYATDPNYAENLIRVIRKYDLNRLDNENYFNHKF